MPAASEDSTSRGLSPIKNGCILINIVFFKRTQNQTRLGFAAIALHGKLRHCAAGKMRAVIKFFPIFAACLCNLLRHIVMQLLHIADGIIAAGYTSSGLVTTKIV